MAGAQASEEAAATDSRCASARPLSPIEKNHWYDSTYLLGRYYYHTSVFFPLVVFFIIPLVLSYQCLFYHTT